ncbi:hypothetical protein ACFPFU_21465 [Negadavirga shengliensis]|uniref:Uncharacterized protein n=1 Tax=Negadavirga shengliensis TaxID=1389218 RepID=A0ABV9T6Y8_9BACT
MGSVNRMGLLNPYRKGVRPGASSANGSSTLHLPIAGIPDIASLIGTGYTSWLQKPFRITSQG